MLRAGANGITGTGAVPRTMDKSRNTHDDVMTTKIAVLMSGRKVSPHFGNSEEVMLIEVEAGDIKSREILNASPRECGSLVSMLKEKEVNKIITGKIGARALENLDSAGITVYSGAKGSVENALGSLLSGRLVSSEAVCRGELNS